MPVYAEKPSSLHPLLAGYQAEFEVIKQDVDSLTQGLDDRAFNWRVTPGTWSIAECLGHLIISAREALPVIDRQINRLVAEGRRSQGPYGRTWLGNLFIKIVEPPYRMRAKTFKNFVPPPDQRLDAVIPTFLALQDEIIERLAKVNGFDLGAVREKNPAGISLTLAQWFPFVASHERRHLWQVRNVRNHSSFLR